MSSDLLIALAREAVLLMVLASVPPLLASVVAGALMGFLQAATQIQEASLSAVPKLGAALLALVLTAPWIGAQLTRFAGRLFLALAGVQL